MRGGGGSQCYVLFVGLFFSKVTCICCLVRIGGGGDNGDNGKTTDDKNYSPKGDPIGSYIILEIILGKSVPTKKMLHMAIGKELTGQK